MIKKLGLVAAAALMMSVFAPAIVSAPADAQGISVRIGDGPRGYDRGYRRDRVIVRDRGFRRGYERRGYGYDRRRGSRIIVR